MLTAAPGVGYIHEPFNPGIRRGVNPVPFDYWFKFLCETNAGPHDRILEELLNYKYPFLVNLGKVDRPRNIARISLNQAIYWIHKLRKRRPLIKDPIAFFSADWLHRRFQMDVIVLIRHPAAFCSSLKIKDWQFDFNHFLKQPLLMERYLHPFEREIGEYARKQPPILEQAILLWNCIHHTVRIYQEEHPDWLFYRHEDLSISPIKQFKEIFDRLDLEFTPAVEKEIRLSTGEHNPVEQDPLNEFNRNSRKNIYNWKKRLATDEISLIRDRTASVADSFYSPEEWGTAEYA